MLDGSHPAPPARPVAEARLAGLPDGEALAKGWLLTLIAGAPLASAGNLPAAAMAREAPALCDAAIAALASDEALARLEPGGDLQPLAAHAGSMTGATDPSGVVASLAALRSSLWHAVADELRSPEPTLVAALAARLARVCDAIAAAVFAGAAAAETRPAMPEPPATAPQVESVEDLAEEAAPDAGDDGPRLAVVPPPAVPADVFPTLASGPAPADASWATAVVGRLSRLLAERGSCAILAVDLDDAERLLAADVRGEAAAAIERAELAIHDALRPGDTAVAERPGRVWVVAGDTTIEAARTLAQRIIEAVAATGELHGAPLRASVGLATSPTDGDDAASLIAHADEGVFAARAAGVSLA